MCHFYRPDEKRDIHTPLATGRVAHHPPCQKLESDIRFSYSRFSSRTIKLVNLSNFVKGLHFQQLNIGRRIFPSYLFINIGSKFLHRYLYTYFRFIWIGHAIIFCSHDENTPYILFDDFNLTFAKSLTENTRRSQWTSLLRNSLAAEMAKNIVIAKNNLSSKQQTQEAVLRGAIQNVYNFNRFYSPTLRPLPSVLRFLFYLRW